MNAYPAPLRTPGAFAAVALAPSRAAVAPIVRGLVQRVPGATLADLDGVAYLHARFADTPAALAALLQILRAGYGLRALMVEAAGHICTGATSGPLCRWLACYAQRRRAGVGPADCQTVARNISTARAHEASPIDAWSPCAALAAYASGAIELQAGAPADAQLDALADRLGLSQCPRYRSACQRCMAVSLPASK